MEAILGSICVFGFNYAPYQWALCQGQILNISQNTALFSLLGNYYGGNGTSTFGLPNLVGRMAIGQGNGAGLPSYQLGQMGGTSTAALNMNTMPMHTHAMTLGMQLDGSGNTGTSTSPVNTYLSYDSADTYSNAAAASSYLQIAPGNILKTDIAGGGGNPFSVNNPSLTMNYCIALAGIFPQRP